LFSIFSGERGKSGNYETRQRNRVWTVAGNEKAHRTVIVRESVADCDADARTAAC